MNNLDGALQRSAQLSHSLDRVQKFISQMADELYAVELRKSLPSLVRAISPFIAQLMHFLAKFRIVDGSELEIEMALQEALTNAVVHGNHEDPDKCVQVVCHCTVEGEVCITIRDEGQGFDSYALPDPTAADNVQCEHGRGIFLMRAFMDEVTFEEGGTVVHMLKKSNFGSAAQRKTQ